MFVKDTGRQKYVERNGQGGNKRAAQSNSRLGAENKIRKNVLDRTGGQTGVINAFIVLCLHSLGFR